MIDLKALKLIGRLFSDYPFVASLTILVLVVGHFIVAQRWTQLNIAAALACTRASDPISTLTSLALGVAGVSALVGGFAGVVVVFGLGTENDRFRLLRSKGQRRLRANWISVVLSSFAGAFGAVLAGVIVVGFDAASGMWVLEVCLLLTAHGAIRLTALLAGLARIVDASDLDVDRKQATVPTDLLLPTESAQGSSAPS